VLALLGMSEAFADGAAREPVLTGTGCLTFVAVVKT